MSRPTRIRNTAAPALHRAGHNAKLSTDGAPTTVSVRCSGRVHVPTSESVEPKYQNVSVTARLVTLPESHAHHGACVKTTPLRSRPAESIPLTDEASAAST